jgi:acetyltransferase-like isoleucine patch superfamily enzyme
VSGESRGEQSATAAVQIAELLGAALAAPLRLLYSARLLSFETGGQILSMIPGMPGIFVRRAWYRRTLARCGPGLIVGFGAVILHSGAEVGANVYIGKHALIGMATIGDDLLCSDRVQVLSGARHHGFENRAIPMNRQGNPHLERVTLGADVWLGANAVITADVADQCIVAAGAVVVKAIDDPWLIVGGVPARRLAERP